jgi:hypothetical protein
MDHLRSPYNASSFETALRSLSLSNDASDGSDSLKCKLRHIKINTAKDALTDSLSQDLSPHSTTYQPGHQRNVSRKSSYPFIPSPLGPKIFTDDLASDVSGLVPSSITTPRRRGARHVSQPELKRRSLPMSTSPISLSEQHRMLGPASFSSYHRRQLTDPFIDRDSSSGVQSPGLNYGQASSISISPLPSPGLDHGQQYAQAPLIGTPPFPSPGPNYTQTPSIPTQARHPDTAPLTEQQKLALRQAWIADGAREIAALARRRATLECQFQLSGTVSDLQALQEATKALADATHLDHRVEQRRKLFMPCGMRAMRVLSANHPGDGFGDEERGGNQGGEGSLLRGEMALMERICGEMVRSAEDRKRGRV